MAQRTVRAAQVFGFVRGVTKVRASVLWLVSAIMLAPALAGSPAQAQVGSDRYAALVIEANSGEVLFSRNANRQLHPASLTKMMTLYMAFRAVERGELHMDQLLTVSAAADAMPASHLNLPAGDTIRVEDAILSLVTRSANDMAVVLAEAMGGTESGFARRMTEQARALGMSRTVFRNASGLPDSAQVSTAHDMGILARALLRDFPQYYHYFGTRSWRYRGTSYTNHNRLLHTYDGADGFKTGYIRASGFNLVASATRGNVRLIAVMFGGSTSEERNRHVASIL